MFLIWLDDLLRKGPNLGHGRVYISVSPHFDHPEVTPTGVPVGLDDDAEYLGSVLRRLVQPSMVNPPGTAGIRDPQAFKRRVSLALLEAEDLEVISVWNPSFLALWYSPGKTSLIKTMG